ncbi:MAG: sugar phosphate isomerase/epimerase [Planctomycetota bacterium]|nr:sugar phosphate isomerase/epimerase [Planctomycetota bacterium]
MLVAASTECFGHLPLQEAVDRLLDLEFTSVEISMDETKDQLKPSEVLADLPAAIKKCLDTRRMNIVGYSINITATGEQYYEQFEACCKLAKATRVVTITVPSGEHGTPFNEEIEKLKRCVAIADNEGIRVALRTETNCLSADPDTVCILCEHAKGLGVAIDPSHFIYDRPKPVDYDRLLRYVYQVYLRDTTKEKLQVRIGQGVVEYGRLVDRLIAQKYENALTVHVIPTSDIDHAAEMRKMRLLLESQLI